MIKVHKILITYVY